MEYPIEPSNQWIHRQLPDSCTCILVAKTSPAQCQANCLKQHSSSLTLHHTHKVSLVSGHSQIIRNTATEFPHNNIQQNNFMTWM